MNSDWQNFPLLQLLQPRHILVRRTSQNESTEDVILNYDTHRTRAEIFSESDQQNLKFALRDFCKEKNTNYQQGMNEILAPFMLLVNQGVPFEVAYCSFRLFLDRVFPNIFTESATMSLAGLFKVISLLIKYLSPELYSFFEAQGISVEFFMTSWIITVFAAKIQDFEQVLYIWEYMLRVKNRFFICVLCVSLLENHKEFIIRQELGNALVYLGSISLDSIEAVQELIDKSQELLGFLPNSITLWLQAFDMCDPSTISSKLSYLDKFITLPILPSEFLQELYPEIFFKTCSKGISYVVIDIRMDQDQKNGYLANSALFPLENLAETSKIHKFIQEFQGLKGFSHFVVMGESDLEKEHPGVILVHALIKAGFCFVSIAKGGFFEAHKLGDSKGVVIKKHNLEACRGCLYSKKGHRRISDYLWNGKKKGKGNENGEDELDYLDFSNW